MMTNDSLGVYYTDDEKDSDGGGDNVGDDHDGESSETADFETEMWDRFCYGAGFGRSSSQREED